MSTPITLGVRSEVGRLRKVMIHRPGAEMDRMAPSMMEEFLFDDILYGEQARREHDQFHQVLGLVADEVLDVQHVLAESFAVQDVRRSFVAVLAKLELLRPETAEMLASMGAEELARIAIGGIECLPEVVEQHPTPQIPYILHPLPNLLFMRDPLVVVADGAAVCSMARMARRREPLIMKYAYGHHPRLRLQEQGRLYFDELSPMSFSRRVGVPSLEGGDVLVLSERVLAVGSSERTNELAVDLLAQALKRHTQIETILMVILPKRRSAMHLDTVFTLISENECLVYPPMFMNEGAELLPVVKKDLRGDAVRSELKDSLLQALVEEGFDLQPIACGGRGDRISQQREQWTDGANALALAPGIIALYERNVRTAEELAKHGYAVKHAREVLAGSQRLPLDRKLCILIPGTELSRARGGPRCMVMPLVRD